MSGNQREISPVLSRRRALLVAVTAVPAAAIGVSTAGCGQTAPNDRALSFTTLAEALNELNEMAVVEPLPPATAWSWAQTLVHCAQSIEYSMTGFPQMRSALFQNTLGSAAFSVFAWRGRMTHDLGEPIPGAPPLQQDITVAAATARVEHAVNEFAGWEGPLRPHFAYGDLDKNDYELAHAMHLANHFSAFGPAG